MKKVETSPVNSPQENINFALSQLGRARRVALRAKDLFLDNLLKDPSSYAMSANSPLQFAKEFKSINLSFGRRTDELPTTKVVSFLFHRPNF